MSQGNFYAMMNAPHPAAVSNLISYPSAVPHVINTTPVGVQNYRFLGGPGMTAGWEQMNAEALQTARAIAAAMLSGNRGGSVGNGSRGGSNSPTPQAVPTPAPSPTREQPLQPIQGLGGGGVMDILPNSFMGMVAPTAPSPFGGGVPRPYSAGRSDTLEGPAQLPPSVLGYDDGAELLIPENTVPPVVQVPNMWTTGNREANPSASPEVIGMENSGRVVTPDAPVNIPGATLSSLWDTIQGYLFSNENTVAPELQNLSGVPSSVPPSIPSDMGYDEGTYTGGVFDSLMRGDPQSPPMARYDWYQDWQQSLSQPWTPTVLSPEEEVQFRQDLMGTKWYEQVKARTAPGMSDAQLLGEILRPDADYDYRGAWKAGAMPEDYANDDVQHWPSVADGRMLKSPTHPTAWMEYWTRQFGSDPVANGVTSLDQALYYMNNGMLPQLAPGHGVPIAPQPAVQDALIQLLYQSPAGPYLTNSRTGGLNGG